MAKKKNETQEVIEKIFDYTLEDIMGERFGSYSKYIIQDRAIPDARDGLKPVQRRILYSMHKEKNTYDRGYRKSAKTVGDVIGNYHPHGDTSIYDAMVRMSQPWKTRLPYIDMVLLMEIVQQLIVIQKQDFLKLVMKCFVILIKTP